MKTIKVWPHMTIVAVLVAALAGLGVALYLRNERTASAEVLPNAARIQRVDGEVGLNNSLRDDEESAKWITADANHPISVGDRIYTRDNARASIAFTGRNFARLDPNTALDVVTLADRRTQLAMRNGSAFFDVGYLAPNELFEVGTPHGSVVLVEPGLYNMAYRDDGSVAVSVLSGLAQVVGLAGSGEISKGEMLTLLGQTAAEVALSRLDGRDAGYLVDDYYRYQYPNSYDGRYSSYDAYLNDPFYYDPYRRNVSYKYVTYAIPGVNDLDYYGDWQDVSGYGYAWRPRVEGNWAPYQQGYWTNDYPYGLTWVSSEPWGYAPYHYGRWASVNNQWFWIPEAVNTTPVYSPALVAFVPLNDANQIGWVALGPGDSYAPRYYDMNWQPHYLTRADLAPTSLVNLAIPNALTVVPLDAFGRVIDPRMIVRIDPQVVAQVRPTLEPLTLTPLRNAVLHSAWGRGKIDLPPGIARKLFETPIMISAAPTAPPFRKDLAKVLRVESVPEKNKDQKFKVRDLKGEDQTRAARQQQIDTLSREAARGNQDARRQMQELQQQQKKDQADQNKAQRKEAQQAQGERVSGSAKQPPPAAGRTEPQPKAQPKSPGKPAPKAKPAEQSQKKGKGKP
jgi:hypothetical protein